MLLPMPHTRVHLFPSALHIFPGFVYTSAGSSHTPLLNLLFISPTYRYWYTDFSVADFIFHACPAGGRCRGPGQTAERCLGRGGCEAGGSSRVGRDSRSRVAGRRAGSGHPRGGKKGERVAGTGSKASGGGRGIRGGGGQLGDIGRRYHGCT